MCGCIELLDHDGGTWLFHFNGKTCGLSLHCDICGCHYFSNVVFMEVDDWVEGVKKMRD